MLRFVTISALCLAAISAAEAGQITIGSNINANGIGSNGLTAAYINGTTTSCAGYQLYGNTCAVGSATGFTQQNYDTALFGSALTSTGTAISPYTGYNKATVTGTTSMTPSAVTGQTTMMTMSGLNLSAIDDSANTTANDWQSLGVSSITVPIGIYGVKQVYTMLDDLYGTYGSSGSFVSVQFNFSSSSSSGASGNLTPVVVPLLGGVEIRGAVDCTGPGTNPVGTGQCPSQTETQASSTTLVNGVSETGDAAGLSVSTQIVDGPMAYTGTTTSATGPFAGTAGMIFLDEEGFNFSSAYMNDYLVSLTVTESNGTSGISNAALTAVTVNTFASLTTAPEPSSILLIGGGLVGLGLFRTRRKATKRA